MWYPWHGSAQGFCWQSIFMCITGSGTRRLPGKRFWPETAGRDSRTGAGPAALAGEKLEARLEEQIMPGELPGHWIREAGEGMEIRLTGQVFSLGSRKILEYEAAAEAQRVRPVSFLRSTGYCR